MGKEDSMFASTLRASRVAQAIGVSILFWLASSAAAPVGSVAAPQFAVGDHWRYRITDNLRRGAVSQLDVEVTSVTGRAAQIRVHRTDANGPTEWIDEIDGEGGLSAGSLSREPARPFNPAVQLLAFPLDQGKTWRQTINTMRKDTGIKDQILIYGKVNGAPTVTVPAGKFDTVSIYRTVQLDDAEFWRSRTFRTDSVWYAPAVKAPVREKREAYYNQRDRGMPQVRTESTVLELLSFQPGAK
jgi:hypothetical protein